VNNAFKCVDGILTVGRGFYAETPLFQKTAHGMADEHRIIHHQNNSLH
jgi:hypothetical protein